MSATDPPPDLGIGPGDVLGGKYRVERVIGSGGMGVVLAAHHLQLDERVALKLLRPEAVSDADAVARFVREARAAVKIKSEHVARVTDVGQLDGGVPYMVMEYLEGRDLATWLEESGPLSPEQVVEFVLQACEAMAEAHGLGVVHRDLKPSNLFCIRRADGRASVKVLDFGISKLSGPRADPRVTRTDTVVGSPAYMSPEQMQASRKIDARTDIWSLGVVLYQLLSGRLPFEGEAATDLAIKIATSTPPPLRSLAPEVPAGLEQVVLRCLEKDRAHRFQNVGELARALEPYGPARARASVERVLATVEAAASRPLASPEVAAPPPGLLPGAPTITMATWGQTGTLATKRARNALVGVGLVATLAVGILLVARPRPPSPSFATSTGAPIGLPPAVAPLPAQSVFAAPASSTTPPTVSPTDLPLAPPPTVRPAASRLAPSRPTSSSPALLPAPSTRPAYNPLEHL